MRIEMYASVRRGKQMNDSRKKMLEKVKAILAKTMDNGL